MFKQTYHGPADWSTTSPPSDSRPTSQAHEELELKSLSLRSSMPKNCAIGLQETLQEDDGPKGR